MKIGNHHVRSSSRYVYKTIDGVQYQFTGATFVDMTKVRYLASKATKGKVALYPTKRGIELQEDKTIRYYEI